MLRITNNSSRRPTRPWSRQGAKVEIESWRRIVSRPKMKKILIVDDELFVRQLVKVKLEIIGFRVIEGMNGEEAIEKAVQEQPDLILLDVMMPKMNGFETCRRLKEHIATSH